MGEYLKGWRRKVGVMTLLMASVFAAGWVRSIFVTDIVTYSINHTYDAYLSTEGRFGFFRQHDERIINSAPYWESIVQFWESGPAPEGIVSERSFSGVWCGFAYFKSKTDHAWFIPFWSIVIPLALFSAWLLLSKPRKRKS